jgi:hypothetical protein
VAVAEPAIKRYALIPKAGEDGIRRFRLARVGGDPPTAERLERMEEIAGLDGPAPARPDAGGQPEAREH